MIDTKISELIAAVRCCDHNGVKRLLGEGANPRIRTSNDRTLLEMALMNSDTETARLLIDAGANINARAKNRHSMLYCAFDYDNIEIARYLVEKGASINTKLRFGGTLLCNAIEEKNREFAELLINAGADVNKIGDHKYPVMIAAEQNDVGMLKLLLEKGARLDIEALFGGTVLKHIMNNGGPDAKKYLEENWLNKYNQKRKAGYKFEPVKITDIGFKDAIGMERVKEELKRDLIYQLRNRELAKKYKVSINGGIMLFGPPGCGKTYIAKAVAGETGVNFINVKISDVFDMLVGSEGKAIKKLFEVARENTPCIIFLDEMEMLGTNREAVGHNVWMKEALNMLLVELDGVASSNEGILVIGATNAPWLVDPALKRHGRMGKFIFVPAPDKKMRDGLFRMYLHGRPLGDDVDYERLSGMTGECNAADIKAICDEAAKLAWQHSIDLGSEQKIGMEDLLGSYSKEKYNMKEWLENIKVHMSSEANKSIYSELDEALKGMDGGGGAPSNLYR